MKEKPKVGTPKEEITIPISSILGNAELSSCLFNLSLYMLIICPAQPNFRNGVTNGASWYPITGGMKDFSYQGGNSIDFFA